MARNCTRRLGLAQHRRGHHRRRRTAITAAQAQEHELAADDDRDDPRRRRALPPSSAISTPETSSLSAVVSRNDPSLVVTSQRRARRPSIQSVAAAIQEERGGRRLRGVVAPKTSAMITGVGRCASGASPGRPSTAARSAHVALPGARDAIGRRHEAAGAMLARRSPSSGATRGARRLAFDARGIRGRGRPCSARARRRPTSSTAAVGVAGELAAHADPAAVTPAAAYHGRDQPQHGGCGAGRAGAASAALPRSAAIVYCVRSLVPIEKKSTSAREALPAAQRGRRHLDHDADLDRRRAADAARAASSSARAARSSAERRDHREHHRTRGARRATRSDRAQLRARSSGCASDEAQPAHARGTGSPRAPCAHERQRLVGAGVERADDQRPPVERRGDLPVAPRPARPRSAARARSRKRNSVRSRPTPSAPWRDRRGGVVGAADVGGHLDRRAVAA